MTSLLIGIEICENVVASASTTVWLGMNTTLCLRLTKSSCCSPSRMRQTGPASYVMYGSGYED